MENLSHWDFAIEFSAKEVAALIVGIDPVAIPIQGDYYCLSSEPVLQRIIRAETSAMVAIGTGQECPVDSLKNNVTKRREIDPNANGWKAVAVELILSTDNDYKIARAEIVRWLSAIDLPSMYHFDLTQTQPVESLANQWPWGNHHTVLLGHLAAAAQRYWVKYDPTDATTAPTNKDVAEWLMTEHKVSQKMADAIASMLRPDGLPTGPRK